MTYNKWNTYCLTDVILLFSTRPSVSNYILYNTRQKYGFHAGRKQQDIIYRANFLHISFKLAKILPYPLTIMCRKCHVLINITEGNLSIGLVQQFVHTSYNMYTIRNNNNNCDLFPLSDCDHISFKRHLIHISPLQQSQLILLVLSHYPRKHNMTPLSFSLSR